MYIALNALKGAVLGHDDHHGHFFVDERDGTVLHLAGRVAFGVDVGDLLELERALHGNRVGEAAA